MKERTRSGTVLGTAMIVLCIALLATGLVLRLAQNGNLDRLPGIVIVLAGACLPIVVAVLAAYLEDRRGKRGPGHRLHRR